jgi:alkanesulfonate monooxygenase SsuD/methylene tetrahydromethanopterin reductase-like flavin-dependent oxidoreductase (luciferase family)
VATLGHGIQDWMGQVGARAESPMTLLREHTAAVRRLLDGETVTVDGTYVRLDQVALDWPPARRPDLLVGARGPRTIRLAGELADGVLLDMVTDPAVVRRARSLVDEARTESGRDGRARVCVYTAFDPAEDPAGLPARVADWTAELGEAGADTVILQGTEAHPDARDLLRAIAGDTGRHG